MRRLICVLSVAAGIVVALGGMAASICLSLVNISANRGSAALVSNTVALAIGTIGLGCGASLVWAGSSAARGLPDRPFRMAAWAWWLVALLAVLGAGQAAFNAREPLALLSAFHLLAGMLAAALFLSLAAGAARSARDERLPGLRAIAGSVAWGALGGAGIAMLLELVLLAIVAAVVGFWLAATRPELAAQLRAWTMAQMFNRDPMPDWRPLAAWLRSPVVALGALGLLSVVVPLIEETTKSLAVPLVGLSGARLTPLRGFLIGAAAGAGFAMLESILNGTPGLTSPSSWASLMLVRSGTAALHCLASGLAGLAWQAILTGRQFAKALAFFIAALALHGIWNAAASLSAIATLVGQTGGVDRFWSIAAQVLTSGFIAVLWLAVVLALPLIARHLASGEQLVPVEKSATA